MTIVDHMTAIYPFDTSVQYNRTVVIPAYDSQLLADTIVRLDYRPNPNRNYSLTFNITV